MPTLPIIAQTLPSGFCPADYQGLLNGFASNLFAQIASSSSAQWVFSSTKPADTSGNTGWFQLDSSGRPIRPYLFAQGAWLALHPTPPDMISIYLGDVTPAVLNLFDGGDTNAASQISGPMWELVTQLAGRVPVGVGTLNPSGRAIVLGDTGGEDKHTLVEAEIPDHHHADEDVSLAGAVGLVQRSQVGTSKTATSFDDNGAGFETNIYDSPYADHHFGGDEAHENMPPYWTVNFIRRTSRLFYRVDA